MGLADVKISLSDFDFVYEHISTYAPTEIRYGNMHLRETRQRNKKRVLRSLHALRVRPGSERAIDGMICGPGLLWGYEIVPGRTLARVIVSIPEEDEKEDDRMGDRFLRDILDRIAEEQGEDHPPPTLSTGQLYLRRAKPAMAITHPNCQSAIGSKTLDPRFLAQILPWGFRLIVGG